MSLVEDLRPFFQTARVFGFAPYSVHSADLPLSRIAAVYSGLCTLCYGYLLYVRLQVLTSSDVEIKLRFLTILRTVLSESVILVDIFVCIRWHDKLQSSLGRMRRYDIATKLRATETTRATAIRCWLGLGLTAVYFVSLGWLTYVYETAQPLESSILYVVLYMSTTFGIVKFAAIVASLLRRFRHLNRLLRAGTYDDEPMIGWPPRRQQQQQQQQQRLHLRDAWCLHGCLVAAAEDLNAMYSVQLLLWIVGLTFNVISRIYVFCDADGILSFAKVLREGGIAAVFVVLLTVLAGVCHMTAAEANKVGSITFSPDSGIFRGRHNSEMDESIQIGLYFLFHQFNFSAASGFLQVDLPLLTTIAGTMTTYLVILKAPG